MAGSIKLFQFFQKFHQFNGIFHASQSNQKQHPINAIKAVILSFFCQYMLTTAAFLIFEANSIFDYGYTFYMLITVTNSWVVYSIFQWQSKNTLKYIENCEGFIEKRIDSMTAYEGLIKKIELLNKLFCSAICTTSTLLYCMALPYSLARYYLFDMGTDAFYLFSPSWYPFDWKTPSGYLVAWFAQCAGGLFVGNVNIQFSNLLVGSCVLFTFIAEDITQDVVGFNFIATNEPDENRLELTKRFCDIVQIFSDAKQCVKEFNQMNKYSLLVFLSWTMLGAASALVTLQFQFWDDDSNSFEIGSSFSVLNWMITFIFLICEPGEIMTKQFDLFSDELSRCDWYLLPIEMQQLYVIFLVETQNPIKILSYGNITCERETSKKMINTAFSYFMTIRRFRA